MRIQLALGQLESIRGEGLSIEISFNTDMVNAIGCWIMTHFDGRNYRMYAATTMETPFADGITGGAIENPCPTVEYFLLKVVQKIPKMPWE